MTPTNMSQCPLLQRPAINNIVRAADNSNTPIVHQSIFSLHTHETFKTVNVRVILKGYEESSAPPVVSLTSSSHKIKEDPRFSNDSCYRLFSLSIKVNRTIATTGSSFKLQTSDVTLQLLVNSVKITERTFNPIFDDRSIRNINLVVNGLDLEIATESPSKQRNIFLPLRESHA